MIDTLLNPTKILFLLNLLPVQRDSEAQDFCRIQYLKVFLSLNTNHHLAQPQPWHLANLVAAMTRLSFAERFQSVQYHGQKEIPYL